MPQCQGRDCGTKFQPTPGAAFRYTEAQCKRACAEGSNLCKVCTAHEEKNMAGMPIGKSGWHGRMGVFPLPAGTHIRPNGSERSKWNVDKTLEETKAAARVATNAAAGGAPAAVKAAKVAVKASKEVTDAAKVAAKFERELDAALRKQDREMSRAETAVAAGGAPVAVKAVKEASEAAKAAAKFERNLDAALLKMDREMRRTETAAARAVAASRRTKKKKSSSSGFRPTSSSSGPAFRRSRSSSQIYRPASAASASGSPRVAMPRDMGTPVSPRKQERNPQKLNEIGESLIALPELA